MEAHEHIQRLKRKEKMAVWTPFWRTLFILLYLDFDHHDLSLIISLMGTCYKYIDDQSEIVKCKITRWKRKRINVVHPIRLMLSHCTQKITIRTCTYSYRFSPVTQPPVQDMDCIIFKVSFKRNGNVLFT
ncbi:hypothetical protein T07_2698 [Trichinella nelsoni]|uniref:Uncharacterized protein n=1 Tax=Trichinella nelsoni TaxID=6336 RepID=A0A0V0RR64_9BILA|nr:hypothetical protein T07_2698 [Trichinella nelsoni]